MTFDDLNRASDWIRVRVGDEPRASLLGCRELDFKLSPG